MNKATFIGNLTRDPELRSTTTGAQVCNFTIAVNRRTKRGQPAEVDYVRVTVWRDLAQICGKYLAKGRKVACTGSVSASGYISKLDGKPGAMLELNCDDVEFLSSLAERSEGTPAPAQGEKDAKTGFTVVDEELPF